MEHKIPSGLFTSIVKYVLKHQEHLSSVLKCFCPRFYFHKKGLRISVAAIVRIEYEDKFLLIKNHHRTEFYGPFGGVFKYYKTAKQFLDSIEFIPQSTRVTNAKKQDDLKLDLRGFIPIKYLPSFLIWFKEQKDRETVDCLQREMKEELQEASITKDIIELAKNIQFTKVRTISEGPFFDQLNSIEYPQYRLIEVYDIVETELSKYFLKQLFERASKNHYLLVVERNEIKSLRTYEGQAIAPHAKYFFQTKWHGKEPLPFK
ncbi:MAG: hypothetical protein AB7U26_00080 [Sulfuricurvum sp.]